MASMFDIFSAVIFMTRFTYAFIWLFSGHFIADLFLAQTAWEGLNKKKSWLACGSHAFKYTLVLGVFSWIAGWTLTVPYLVLLILMGALHGVIDRRWIPVKVLQLREYTPLGTLYFKQPIPKPSEYPEWLVIWVDQVLHLIQILILAGALARGW